MSRNDDLPGSEAVGPIVLVVDDNVDNQELLTYLLQWLGYRTDVASNGVQAIAAFARNDYYTAVFMDCEMPQMDGFQATRELRRLERPGRRTPIVAITAHPSRDVRDRCLAAGMDDCLTKPVRAEDLSAAVAAILREQRRLAGEEGVGEVDLAALAGLAEQIGTLALTAVLETFSQETGNRLKQLHDAVTAGDAPEVARVAHSIKGAASSLGAKRLAEQCNDLQRLADGKSLSGAGEQAAALEATFHRATAAAADLLDAVRQHRQASSDAAPSPSAGIPQQPEGPPLSPARVERRIP
jgi:CheY-like chemotaxis protein